MTERNQLIDVCFQRGQALTLDQAMYGGCVTKFVGWLMESDNIGDDQTTKLLSLSHPSRAVILAKQSGILAGMQEALFVLRDSNLDAKPAYQDGDQIEKGQILLILTGDIADLLRFERTILNIIGRMSGIATQTRRMVDLAGGKVKVAATRKTPWMYLDKRAVFCGGGLTHRLDLHDSVLVKDNHLEALMRQIGSDNREDAVQRTVELALASSRQFFEIEVETPGQAQIAFKTFEQRDPARKQAMVVMLDNFDPDGAAEVIGWAKESASYSNILFEASGDITETTLPLWIQSGVDVVSMGALTHSPKNFNVSMGLAEGN
jgi:nicotinate-nucleotide pyrophosphorylase (carboxylating)